jgi:RNA polymerase sigma-70 factor (ECF subfamily)
MTTGLVGLSINAAMNMEASEMTAQTIRNSEEAVLIDSWQAGKRRAGHHLLMAHVAALDAYLQKSRLGKNADERSEIRQQTLLEVTRVIRNFRGECSFRTFLFAVAKRVHGAQIRKQRRRPVPCSIEQSEVSEPAAPAEEPLEHTSFYVALRELEPDTRGLLDMQLLGMGCQEVAASLGVSGHAASCRLSRARKQLFARLQAHAND